MSSVRGLRAVVCAALVLAAVASGSVPRAAADATALIPGAKSTGDLAIAVTPRQTVTPSGAPATATLLIGATRAVAGARVTVTALGPVATATPELLVGAMAAGEHAERTVRYSATGAGEGTVTIRVETLSASGAVTSWRQRSIYVNSDATETLYGAAGPLALRVERLDRDHQAGRLSDSAYAERLSATAGGGAAVVTRAAPALGRVAGTIKWLDRRGQPQAARHVTVQLRTAAGSIVRSVTTDTAGRYSIATAEAGDYEVRALSTGPGYVVGNLQTGQVHYISSGVVPVPSSGLTVDLTANNVDDNNTAFSVAGAMELASSYAATLAGQPLPLVAVNYPSPFGTFYNPSAHIIDLLEGDRFDWDVADHEYGHHIANVFTLDDNPGGSHGFENLSERLGKPVGVRLAYGEGLATYHSISAQVLSGAAALGIPFVGDNQYSDTEDASFEYSLESDYFSVPGTPFFATGTGEDNELSVQRALWDFMDAHDDAGDSGVALGNAEVFDAMAATHPTNLSEIFQALVAGRSYADRAAMGCVLTQQLVAPAPLSPADGVALPASPPNFTWAPNGGGPSYRNNEFVVEFYDAGFDTLLFESPVRTVPRYTPTPSAWSAIVAGSGGSVHWLVRGTQTAVPVTGPYPSCARTLG